MKEEGERKKGGREESNNLVLYLFTPSAPPVRPRVALPPVRLVLPLALIQPQDNLRRGPRPTALAHELRPHPGHLAAQLLAPVRRFARRWASGLGLAHVRPGVPLAHVASPPARVHADRRVRDWLLLLVALAPNVRALGRLIPPHAFGAWSGGGGRSGRRLSLRRRRRRRRSGCRRGGRATERLATHVHLLQEAWTQTSEQRLRLAPGRCSVTPSA